jgi:hypothetical protein
VELILNLNRSNIPTGVHEEKKKDVAVLMPFFFFFMYRFLGLKVYFI